MMKDLIKTEDSVWYVQSERQASGLYLDYAKQLVEQETLITASVIKSVLKV